MNFYMKETILKKEEKNESSNIGCRSNGRLGGQLFKKGGAEVWLVDPFEAHMKKIAGRGLNHQFNHWRKKGRKNQNERSDEPRRSRGL